MPNIAVPAWIQAVLLTLAAAVPLIWHCIIKRRQLSLGEVFTITGLAGFALLVLRLLSPQH